MKPSSFDQWFATSTHDDLKNAMLDAYCAGAEASEMVFKDSFSKGYRAGVATCENRIAELEAEIRVDNQLLKDRERLLGAIPPCPEHGSNCVPHAIEWIATQNKCVRPAKWYGTWTP